MIHRDQPIQVTNAIRAAMYLVNPEKKISAYGLKPLHRCGLLVQVSLK